MNASDNTAPLHEFVTIIGRDLTEIADAFRAQGLAAQEYSIVHRVGSHRFTKVDSGKAEPLFDGERLLAATFQRSRAS